MVVKALSSPRTKSAGPKGLRAESARAVTGSADGAPTVHNVHFVKYDVTVSFYDAVSDKIRRRGGDRGIFTEEGVDTVAYFGGNHGFRV